MGKYCYSFLKPYLSYLPKNISDNIFWKANKESDVFEVPDEMVQSAKKEWEKWNVHLPNVTDLNNKGESLEKQGKIEEAIKVYRESMTSPYKTPFPFDRLMIIYRKNKEYQLEKCICNLAMIHFKNDKYAKRLKKIEDLLNK